MAINVFRSINGRDDVTALLERGIWQLTSLTEYLEVGIALKLSPPAPARAPPGKSLELTRLRLSLLHPVF